MILEEETHEKFGYYPCELSRGSHKRILAKCDDCGKVREISKYNFSVSCYSCAKKEKRNHNWKEGLVECACLICGKKFEVVRFCIKNGGGKYCSRNCTGIAQSKNRVGKNNPNWKGGKIKSKCQECGRIFEVDISQIKYGWGKYCSHKCSRKHRSFTKSPTMPERTFVDLCIRFDLPYHFVGDRQFWIGTSPSLNPDFIHTNKRKKICVEVFGAWWHNSMLNQKVPYERTYNGRKALLKSYGWKMIGIWDHDLLRPDAEAFVLTLLYREKGITFRI